MHVCRTTDGRARRKETNKYVPNVSVSHGATLGSGVSSISIQRHRSVCRPSYTAQTPKSWPLGKGFEALKNISTALTDVKNQETSYRHLGLEWCKATGGKVLAQAIKRVVFVYFPWISSLRVNTPPSVFPGHPALS